MKTVSRFATAATIFAATSAYATIETGLVEYWDFNGDYAAYVDASHAGTLVTTGSGSGTFVAGKFGRAIDLDSSNNNQAYVSVGGDENDFDFAGGDMSLSMWYTTESLYTAWQALIAKGEANRWRLARNSSSDRDLNFSGPLAIVRDGELNLRDGSWHHVVVTHDDNNATRLYVDGVAALSGIPTTSLGGNSEPLQIGGNPDVAGRSWDGNIDDVAIWNRVLTPQEIQSIYNNGDGASITSLINAVHFVETTDIDRMEFTGLTAGTHTFEGTLPFVGDQADADLLDFYTASGVTISSVTLEAVSFDPTGVSGEIGYDSDISGFIGTLNEGDSVTVDGLTNTSAFLSLESENFSADNTPTWRITIVAVPEPSSLAVFGLGGLLIARRRRAPKRGAEKEPGVQSVSLLP